MILVHLEPFPFSVNMLASFASIDVLMFFQLWCKRKYHNPSIFCKFLFYKFNINVHQKKGENIVFLVFLKNHGCIYIVVLNSLQLLSKEENVQLIAKMSII